MNRPPELTHETRGAYFVEFERHLRIKIPPDLAIGEIKLPAGSKVVHWDNYCSGAREEMGVIVLRIARELNADLSECFESN